MFVTCGMWCLADVSSISPSSEQTEFITVYTRVQVERVYKSNPIFKAKNTTFLEKV